MNELTRIVTLIKQDRLSNIKISFLIFILTTLDLLSKSILLKKLGFEDQQSTFIFGYFNWFVTPHAGHSFSLFESDVQNHWLTVFTILFITSLLSYPLLFKIKKIAIFCLVLIVSGAVSNVIDKVYNYNATNIMCSIQQSSGLHSVCFNIADFYILIGVSIGLIANAYYLSQHIFKSISLKILFLIPFVVLVPFL